MHQPRRWMTVLAMTLTGGSASAQVSLSVDRLDAADPGDPAPAHLVVIDLLADVATTDAWTACGLKATTANGAVLVYATNRLLVNPSLGDPELEDPPPHDPFVTCFSKPRERNANGRFFNAGAAIAGRFEPPAASPTASATEINVAWFASPPATPASPSVDGYIARLVIDVSAVADLDPATVAVTTGPPPPGSLPLLVSRQGAGVPGTAAASFDVPPLSGINWSVHAPLPSGDPSICRYAFADSTPLPAVPDQSPAHHDATAGPAAALSADVPPDAPAGSGNRSLDCRTNGATTNENLLLTNDAVLLGGGFTLETWFKWYGGGAVNAILDYAGTEKLVIDVRNGGSPTLALRLSNNVDFPIGPVTPGAWHYVAAVFVAEGAAAGTVTGTLTTYLDRLSSPSVTPGAPKSNFGDSLLRGIGIGQHPLGFPLDFFDGLIHSPRVSLAALGPGQLLLAGGARFRRGDANGNGTVDIADAVNVLSFLFTGGSAPACDDAADANDDARMDISDALAVLGFLFLGSSTLPAPGPTGCGADPTPDPLTRCGDPASACD